MFIKAKYPHLPLINTGTGFSPAPAERALQGGLSVKTDIEFVVSAPGGREDPFSAEAVGVLKRMFIYFSFTKTISKAGVEELATVLNLQIILIQ